MLKKYKIYEFGNVITGTTPSTKIKDYYISQDYRFIGPSDLKSNRFVNKSEKYVSSNAMNVFINRSINKNDIMIDCIGSDMGNVAIATAQSLTNQQINSITNINENIVYPLYLYYLLSTKKSYLHLIGSNGSTMPIISKSLFEQIELSIHSLDEQRHIVDTIGSVDDYIEKLQKFNIKIDMLISQLVADFLKNNMCTELRISDCAIVKNGYAFKPTDYLPYPTKTSFEVLKMGHIEIGGGLKFNPKKDFVEITDKLKKFQLLEDDIVMGMTDMKDKVVILGVPALIDESNKYLLNQRVAQIVAKKINPIFLYYQMKDKKFIKDLQLKANKGVQVNLTTDAIKNMTVYNTNDNVFLEKLSNLYDMIKTNNLKIRKSFILKETLLKKYFG